MVSQPVQCTHYAGPLRHRKEHLSELPAYNHPELLVGVELPPALKELLRLYVLLVKKLPETQAADLLQELNRLMEIALYCGDRQEPKLNVDSLIERLRKVMKEFFPEK